jgi:hypothetical protein
MIPSDITMSAFASERPRAVTVIGWTWLILAVFRIANVTLAFVVWKVGGLEKGIPFVPQSAVRALGLDAALRHATAILVVHLLVAAAVAYAAFELLRLEPWARRAIVVLSCLGILATLALAAFTFALTGEAAREAGVEAPQVRIAGFAAAVAIALMGGLLFGATIYFLRRSDVRRAFETPAR